MNRDRFHGTRASWDRRLVLAAIQKLSNDRHMTHAAQSSSKRVFDFRARVLRRFAGLPRRTTKPTLFSCFSNSRHDVHLLTVSTA